MFCLILQGGMAVLVVKSGLFVLWWFDPKYIHKYGYVDKNILSNNGGVKECESCCKEINIYGNPLLSKWRNKDYDKRWNPYILKRR